MKIPSFAEGSVSFLKNYQRFQLIMELDQVPTFVIACYASNRSWAQHAPVRGYFRARGKESKYSEN